LNHDQVKKLRDLLVIVGFQCKSITDLVVAARRTIENLRSQNDALSDKYLITTRELNEAKAVRDRLDRDLTTEMNQLKAERDKLRVELDVAKANESQALRQAKTSRGVSVRLQAERESFVRRVNDALRGIKIGEEKDAVDGLRKLQHRLEEIQAHWRDLGSKCAEARLPGDESVLTSCANKLGEVLTEVRDA
jgi:chromosome segregation ATPase